MPPFSGLAIVAASAFAAPLVLGLLPALRLPAVVLEILLGIVVGPAVFSWVHVDGPVRVISLLGLAFLLLLAGLEVQFDMLRVDRRPLALLRKGESPQIAPSPSRSASQTA